MKRIIISILLLTLVSCENSTEITEEEELHSITGLVSGNANNLTNVEIFINDNKTTVTDSIGQYYLDSLLSGKYNISFKKEFYIQKDTSVFINENLDLNIELKLESSVLPYNERILFVNQNSIYSMSLEGNEINELLTDLYVYSASWSSDRNSVFVVGGLNEFIHPFLTELSVYKIDSQNGFDKIKITKDSERVTGVAANSPDGINVAYLETLNEYEVRIKVINLENNKVRVLTPFLNCNDWFSGADKLSWSKNSDKIYYTNTDNYIYSVDYETTISTKIIETELTCYSPSVSPDYTKLAFTSFVDFGNRSHLKLFIYEFETEILEQITHDKSNDFLPTWTYDSNNMIYMNREGFSQKIKKINFNSQNILIYQVDVNASEANFPSCF